MSQNRIYNFSAGPAALPLPVLERAREELLSLNGIGMSVMEISHRSKEFIEILEKAKSGLRSLMQIPEYYSILFLQGGASLQFSMVPLNFLGPDSSADYITTGQWGLKAIAEARKCGNINEIYTDSANNFRTFPEEGSLNFNADAAYIHYTSNETIEGVEFDYELKAGNTPVICDASSNILSKPFDIENYALIYAGAQKNIGPSGISIVIVRNDMLEKIPVGLHSVLDYSSFAKNDSMPNTPNTWGIYMISLVCEWLEEQGGISFIEQANITKAAKIYEAIDSSDEFYKGHAANRARSKMNITFRLATSDLEDKFCDEALANGFSGLRGHRLIGGIRASVYNAFPKEGITAFVEFMSYFASKNG